MVNLFGSNLPPPPAASSDPYELSPAYHSPIWTPEVSIPDFSLCSVLSGSDRREFTWRCKLVVVTLFLPSVAPASCDHFVRFEGSMTVIGINIVGEPLQTVRHIETKHYSNHDVLADKCSVPWQLLGVGERLSTPCCATRDEYLADDPSTT